ncbi:MAG: RnfABCDGE type electron transport complex subunit D [Phycisphaeraceae bacterium]|nr:RnfABCDGE type electron transport complex subunit D [Phycisphaeraceae bacterium]
MTADATNTKPAASPSAAKPGKPLRRAKSDPPWLGPFVTRKSVDNRWLFVGETMTVAAMGFFGFPGASQVLTTATTAFAVFLLISIIMQLLQPNVAMESMRQAVAQGLILGALMPVTASLWRKAMTGAFLGLALHLCGRCRSVRVHPIAAAMLAGWLAPMIFSGGHPLHQALFEAGFPPAVLRPDRMFVGAIESHAKVDPFTSWWNAVGETQHHDAVLRPVPFDRLIRDQVTILQHPSQLANMLVAGELPRVVELVIGCVPGPLGATSVGLILLLGLMLMMWRMAWLSLAVTICISAAIALQAMPLAGDGGHTVAFWLLADMTPTTAMTYVGYLLLTGPLLSIALLLAPQGAPMTRLGRLIYGIIIGAGVVAGPWWFQAPSAGFIGLAVAGCLARPLDAVRRIGLH